MHQEHQLNKEKTDDDDDEVSLSTNLLNNIHTQEKRMCVVVIYMTQEKRESCTYTDDVETQTAINSQGCEHNNIVRQQRIYRHRARVSI